MRVTFLLALLVVPPTAFAQGARLDNSDDPRINVGATRMIRLVPDRVTLHFLVEAGGDAPAEALRKVGLKVDAVTAAIRQAGAPADAMVSYPYGLTPAPNQNSLSNMVGQVTHVARHVVRVQLSKMDQVIPLSAAAMTAGATSTALPILEASSADSARRVRYPEVVAAARADAMALAASLGGSLGPLVSVSSNNFQDNAFSNNQLQFSNNFSYGGSIPVPEVRLSITVNLAFKFIPR
ncbi:MAG: SIMPL domain-containing protein [Gemmatimonadales bacterium]|nr:SIMPL domain-containing protein [Gemmatimonadales bacterium]